VKLGGSLWDSAALRPWLSRLAAERRTRLVIVPGGGPFADAVRRAQPLLGTSDAAAHRMAILAMEQYAHALLDLEPGLAPAVSRNAILNAEGPVVWLPAAMAMQADLPESWDATSDSIAAWLADEIGADRLVLVKSAALPAGESSVEALVRDGIVDPVLPRRMIGLSAGVFCVARDDLAGFGAALDGHPVGLAACGTRLFLEANEPAHA
jgi:aspartokinase-like uncharacterized kinase